MRTPVRISVEIFVGITRKISGGISWTPGDISVGTPGGMYKGIPGGISGKVFEEIPVGISGRTPEGISVVVPGEIHGKS